MNQENKQPMIEVEPRSSIVYLLRTTQQHHVNLSIMADQKANILIGASFILLTILFNNFQKGHDSIAVVALICFTLLAAFFAVLAVMPAISLGGKKVKRAANPLFFGSFVHLSYDQYLIEMKKILQGDAQVYGAMATDIYQLGQVLYKKKYRYLGYSYRIFIVGFLITFLISGLDFLIN